MHLVFLLQKDMTLVVQCTLLIRKLIINNSFIVKLKISLTLFWRISITCPVPVLEMDWQWIVKGETTFEQDKSGNQL